MLRMDCHSVDNIPSSQAVAQLCLSMFEVDRLCSDACRFVCMLKSKSPKSCSLDRFVRGQLFKAALVSWSTSLPKTPPSKKSCLVTLRNLLSTLCKTSLGSLRPTQRDALHSSKNSPPPKKMHLYSQSLITTVDCWSSILNSEPFVWYISAEVNVLDRIPEGLC